MKVGNPLSGPRVLSQLAHTHSRTHTRVPKLELGDDPAELVGDWEGMHNKLSSNSAITSPTQLTYIHVRTSALSQLTYRHVRTSALSQTHLHACLRIHWFHSLSLGTTQLSLLATGRACATSKKSNSAITSQLTYTHVRTSALSQTHLHTCSHFLWFHSSSLGTTRLSLLATGRACTMSTRPTALSRTSSPAASRCVCVCGRLALLVPDPVCCFTDRGASRSLSLQREDQIEDERPPCICSLERVLL